MLNWNDIETILLDMDGTLLDLHFDNFFWQRHLVQRYAELKSVPLSRAEALLFDKFTATRGSLNWYCLDFWSEELDVDIVALKQEVEHLIAILPFAEEFLKAAQGKKRLCLVTNAHRGSLNLKLAKTGIDRYFDNIISSHDYQLPKESPEFWPLLMQDLQFAPGKTLLAEDNATVLQTAKAFGIAHLLAIAQPDTQAERRIIDDFTNIDNFAMLPPITSNVLAP